MRRFLAAALMLIVAVHARAEHIPRVTQADRTEIQRVITAQIDAFRRNDGDTAFGFASPNIQALFGDTQNFMRMVRRAYQPVYNPRSMHFEELATHDSRIEQRVDLVGPDGHPAIAIYTMEHEADGSWKIDGCQLTEPDRVTA
ncbi:MAG TPA: DUF4864 domain-containing protein [Acetobacteraceae bacterium]|jgi:hypothetical protein|nr:DUF4864 domain-containing protein [Acetobacteraceae bacterium]